MGVVVLAVRARIALVGLLVAGARASDLLITFLISPNLKGEQNVVYVYAGATWPILIALNVAAVVVCIALYAWAALRPPAAAPPGLRPLAFFSYVFFAGRHPWWHALFRFPVRGRNVWVFGRWLVWALIAASIFADVGNLAAYQNRTAARIWQALIGTTLMMAVSITAVVTLSYWMWMTWEYRTYQKASTRAPPS